MVERQAYLVCGLDNHEVVLGCGQNPLAIIGDIYCCDRAAQPWNSCVGACQAPLTVQPYLTIIRSNDNISLPCKHKPHLAIGMPKCILVRASVACGSCSDI